MSEQIIVPESCMACPFSFMNGPVRQCKFYGRGSFMADNGDFPEYCRVKKIVVTEEDEDKAEG
jgi:hypothetical protein